MLDEQDARRNIEHGLHVIAAGSEQQLATSVEKIGFVTDTISDDAGEMRRRLRTGLLTDILRVDISRPLTNTDDPSRTVTLADPESADLQRDR
ncbi:MAG: hypothetical protein ACI9C1_003200 [Candidatus Aldehydirespiratoraceae bacterium]|jgi:hypothetical protein